MLPIAIIFVVAAIAVLAIVLIFKNLIQICQPNEVLVFSGTTRSVGERKVGYKLVQGGRRLLIPLIHRVDRLDLANMIIDVRVQGAYSMGGIPLNVAAVANVKVAGAEPTIGNAIERFLGRDRQEIVRVAKETLEGNLRGVLATLTPEEVNHDRVKFAQSLLHEADIDLRKLGLTLDTLKIQHVTDDKQYLDSIGRKQSAELLMRSRVAEAENQALSAERDAQNYETRTMAKIDAEIELARAEADRRVLEARARKDAMVEEQRTEVVAMVAKATAGVEVQKARTEQVRLQLVADRIKPAEARRDQLIEAAHGKVARIVEEGRATATSLREAARAWKSADGNAARIVVAQKFSTLVGQMMPTDKDLSVAQMTVIDRRLGNGKGNLAADALLASEQLKHGLGVDVPGLVRGLAQRSAFGSEVPPARSPSEPPSLPAGVGRDAE